MRLFQRGGENDDTEEECSSQPRWWAHSLAAPLWHVIPTHVHTRLSASSSSPTFSHHHLCPLLLPYRPTGCPTRVLPMCLGWGERAAAGLAVAFLEEISYSLLLSSVQQAHICARRSSCLDEYLPKSLHYLAVSLQKKAQHHLYGNGRLPQKCFGSNQLN